LEDIFELIALISETAQKILNEGKLRIRVKRAGMLQFQVFTVKRIKHGETHFVELFLPKVIDLSELLRLAKELGLPIEAENGRAFPEGTGAKDFTNL
jgi:hypothetical protein